MSHGKIHLRIAFVKVTSLSAELSNLTPLKVCPSKQRLRMSDLSKSTPSKIQFPKTTFLRSVTVNTLKSALRISLPLNELPVISAPEKSELRSALHPNSPFLTVTPAKSLSGKFRSDFLSHISFILKKKSAVIKPALFL